ncbi:MAG: hypothetical protein AAB539_04040 [Patescibacteria group bacterium]
MQQGQKKRIIVTTIVIAAIIALGAVIGYFSTPDAQRDTNALPVNNGEEPGSSPKATSSTAKNAPLPTVGGDIVEYYDKIILSPVGGGRISGEAVRSLTGGVYILRVSAKNLPSPPTGQEYRAWIKIPDDASEPPIPVGALAKFLSGPLAGISAVVYTNRTKDLKRYREIIVTRQPLNAEKPEGIILRGGFAE